MCCDFLGTLALSSDSNIAAHSRKLYFLIGSGGKNVKSIIEESDDGTGEITMVPAVGDIYRNCEIKSYGLWCLSRDCGLCSISELSAKWLAKPEDAYGTNNTWRLPSDHESGG